MLGQVHLRDVEDCVDRLRALGKLKVKAHPIVAINEFRRLPERVAYPEWLRLGR